MSKQQNKTTNSYSTLDKKLGMNNPLTEQVAEKKQDPTKKISKSYKLGEDVVDFLDRVNYHLGVDRTAVIEELLRNKAKQLNLPPVPKEAEDKGKKLKQLLGTE